MLKETLKNIQAEYEQKAQDAANGTAAREKLKLLKDGCANAAAAVASSRNVFAKEEAMIKKSLTALQLCKQAIGQIQEALNRQETEIGVLC